MWRLFLLSNVVLTCCYIVYSQDVLTNRIINDIEYPSRILDDILINKVVDQLLKFARIAIIEQGMDTVPIPNVNEEFIGPFGIKAQFMADNGSAGYISTVQRTGNATINYHYENATLTLDLGLRQFLIDFPHYKAEILSMGPTGRMQAVIGVNSVYATFYLHYDVHSCQEELGYLFMDKFDDVRVNLTGLYPMNWLLNDLAVWIASDFKNDIKNLIEDTLRQGIKSAMKKYNICKYLPHL